MSPKVQTRRGVSAARRVADFFVLGLTIGVAWFLWPSFLGGSSQMIMVQGQSMEPTYQSGDLVLLDTSVTPTVGDIVVFRIPDDEPGSGNLVVHRLIGRRQDGTYVTKGDNSASPDTFVTKRSDILGSPRVSIAHGGQVISLLASPIGLAAATGMLSTLALWPRMRDESRAAEQPADDGEAISFPVATTVVDFDAQAEEWVREELAWLASAGQEL